MVNRRGGAFAPCDGRCPTTIAKDGAVVGKCRKCVTKACQALADREGRVVKMRPGRTR